MTRLCKRKDRRGHQEKLMRRFAPLISQSALQLGAVHRTSAEYLAGVGRRVADLSDHMKVDVEVIEIGSCAFMQRERDEFRSAVAAMVKTVEISDGSVDFFPLLCETFGARFAESWRFSRERFEPATGLRLIPDGDEDDDSCVSSWLDVQIESIDYEDDDFTAGGWYAY